MHSKKQAQVRVLLFDKASIEVSAEYCNYNDVFLANNAAKLLENIRINKYTIKLEKNKQPLFGSIYNLGSLKLKTLKTYIKTNLANGFNRPFKSSAGALILFDRKPNRSFRFCVDY